MRSFFRVCCEHCSMPSAGESRCRNVGSWASSTSCMEGVGLVGRRHQPCNCRPAARCSALLPATAVNTAARVETFTSFNCPVRRKQRTGTRNTRRGIGGRCKRFTPTAVHGTRRGMTTTVISVPRSGSDLEVKSLSSAAIGARASECFSRATPLALSFLGKRAAGRCRVALPRMP
jgi:hypothetical protein